MTEESTRSPKVFISYAWEDDTKIWVRELATRLRFNGVHAILDQWDVAPGDSLPEFMETSVSASDFVLVVCTPAYKRKSDSSDPSGVGYEKGVITGELFVKRNQRKFIPILRKGKWLESAPSWVLGKNYIDLRGTPLNEDNYQELLRTLYGKREPPPPLGTPPDFSGKDGGKTKPKPFVPRKPIISKDTTAKFTSNLKTISAKLMPSFRLAGILVIISIVLLTVSWAIPKFVALIPTAQTSGIPPANTIITFTKTPVPPTKTIRPNATPTKTRTPAPTATLGVGSTMISDKDGMKLVYVPAGKFTMGSDADDVVAGCKKFKKVITDCQRSRFVDEEPPHSVNVEAFWIDQTEVTNNMYETCVSAGTCDAPVNTSSGTYSSYFGNSEFQNYPVIFVNWDMAKTYCSWAGRRLPTEAEWEKTARGTNANIYPWGNAFDGNKLNFCDINCGISHQDESINDGYGDVSPVGNYPSGRSVFGAYDMAGNVWEWVSTLYRPYPYDAGDGRENQSSSEDRVLRGGSWNSDGNVVRSALRISTTPDMTSWNFGFRCAMDAP